MAFMLICFRDRIGAKRGCRGGENHVKNQMGVGVRKVKVVPSLSLLLAALLAACQSPSQSAKTAPPSPELQRQYDAAFQQMYNNPGNLDAAFNYASLATKVGDFEGAAGAYSSMLLIDPEQPRVRLELGVVYYRLKSYSLARSYLETALLSPDLPADARQSAEALLLSIPKKYRK